MADYSADQIGKRVRTQRGVEIGSVEDVRNGDIYVAVESDDGEDAVSELGWDGPVSQDVHRLPDEYVANVTENEIRLRV